MFKEEFSYELIIGEQVIFKVERVKGYYVVQLGFSLFLVFQKVKVEVRLYGLVNLRGMV